MWGWSWLPHLAGVLVLLLVTPQQEWDKLSHLVLCSVVRLKIEQRGKAERTVRKKCRGRSDGWDKKTECDC